jgi:hypothetical protein
MTDYALFFCRFSVFAGGSLCRPNRLAATWTRKRKLTRRIT